MGSGNRRDGAHPGHARRDFGAPFSRSLWLVSGLVTGVLVLVPVLGLTSRPPTPPLVARFLLIAIPLLILAGSLPFVVRGYRIEPVRLCIRRLGWWTRLDLRELRSAEADPRAMKGSIRLMGNGGLFVFAGWFWNRRLGRYRAFVTDPSRAVVLRFPGRTVVVSPEAPDGFVRSIEDRHGRSGPGSA